MKPGRLSILPCMLSLLPSFINERFKQLEARSCLPENEKKVAKLKEIKEIYEDELESYEKIGWEIDND